MMNRISKNMKAVADAHIKAKYHGGKFDEDPKNILEMIEGLKSGKVYARLLDEIELRYVNITSLMIGAVFQHETKAYKAGVYKGFRVMASQLHAFKDW